jgi:hypothetical protein
MCYLHWLGLTPAYPSGEVHKPGFD